MPMKTNIIALHVIPKASKNEVVGWVDDAGGGKALKVKVTAAPEDGKANAALIKFLSKQWDISPRQLDIVGGHTGRRKRLQIHDEALFSRLCSHVTKA